MVFLRSLQIGCGVLALMMLLGCVDAFRCSTDPACRDRFNSFRATSIFVPYNGVSQENAPIDRRLTPREIVRNRKYDGAHVLFHCRVKSAAGDGTAIATCGGPFDSRTLLLRGDVNALTPHQKIVVDGIVEDPIDTRGRTQAPTVRVLNLQ